MAVGIVRGIAGKICQLMMDGDRYGDRGADGDGEERVVAKDVLSPERSLTKM